MLSSSGICSRRQAESLIKEGRLTVNNEISHLGQKIDHSDLVRIDGKIVDLSNQNSKLRVLMYNKDLGEISSKNDPESRKTIFDSLPKINGGNWFSVGRLDINTSGLILFTNKGDFANQLMHPSSEIEREYVARIRGDVKEKNLEDMINGVQLEDGIARFEFQYLPRLVENHLFDTIYHEHFSYLSFHSVKNIFLSAGLEILASEEIQTHGGSLRVFSRLASTRKIGSISSTEEITEYEKSIGVASSVFYKDFQRAAENCRDSFLDFLDTKKDKRVVAYGAAAKGNTFLNFVGATQESIDYVVDRNTEKIGKYLPGSLLPIMSEARLKEDKPDFVLILPWNIADELVLQLDYVKQWGGTLFTAVPTLRFYE